MRIYRESIPITDALLEKMGRRWNESVDFRVMPTAQKIHRIFSETGEALRPSLFINPKTEPAIIPPLTASEISKLDEAAPYSIVGEVGSFREGLQLLIGLVDNGITSPEFLVAKDIDKGKVFIVKGNDLWIGFLSFESATCPFIASGPVLHTHPGSSLPSFQDFTLPFMTGSFGVVVGYEAKEAKVRLEASKFYCLGPFAVFERYYRDSQALNLLDILTAQPGSIQSFSYMTMSGSKTDDTLKVLEEYRERLKKWATRIEILERELYPDPSVSVKKAIELHNIYIELNHFINSLMLLKRMVFGLSAGQFEGESSSQLERICVTYLNSMNGSFSPISDLL